MSCDKCNQEEMILPEGTVEAYDQLIQELSSYYNSICSTQWDVLREIKLAVSKQDYVKARELLNKVSSSFNEHLIQVLELAKSIPTAITNCLALPLPKNTIKFNRHVKKTYQQPTMCSCATCKYVVRTDITELQDDEELVFTKFACNYENRLTEAKQSGIYTKEEILDQLSVDEQGKCACYEFGDQTDYDEIGEPLPEPGEPGVITHDTVN